MTTHIKDLINNTTHLRDCVDVNYLTSTDEDSLREEIQDYINSEEIIYYTYAIKYLSENDPSLRDSLALASDMGCDMNNLNSETLATIHYQDVMSQELAELNLSEVF